jgi:antirestriction protein ArdC
VYADKIIRTETDADTGEESEHAIPFMKGYVVFNVEQIDGLPEHYYGKPAPRGETVQRIERAESFLAATGATVRHGGNRAFYSPASDHVQMPPVEAFRDAEGYYSTLAHEVTHWTRHPSRLDRDFGRKRYGDEGYAMEELVAELGSAFLAADLELTPEVREDHASYIASWIKVLKNDKRAIFSAASHAQRAADFLHRLQRPADSQADAA